ncbi:hypothetical protein E9536_40745 [Burkholderia sp. LS-044]|uniref:hypothetical protein n=1 Tax=Burkholderia sp. LS-044 TaxID=1459967 RepID=UPI0010A60ED1|nr:hypothetical protein [Burkholderia sp. LS-044]THJ45673.1 hypothetical protein E9536_40745 [Burkholderia sp. LS-044]
MNFATPFTGKPAKPHLSGLFLLDPTVLMKLSGHPMQAMLREALGEARAKRLERALRDNTESPELLDALLDALPDWPIEITAQLRRAAAGDKAAADILAEQGPWETFYAVRTEPLTYSNEYRLALERASRPAEAAFRRGDYGVCAQLLGVNPVLKSLVWDDAVQALTRVKDDEDILAFQFIVAMEVELSCLAALDVQLGVSDQVKEPIFSALLQDPEHPNRNPPALFFQWLRQATGLSTLAEIEARLSLVGTPVHLVTLKNWSRGQQIPIFAWLRLLVALCPNEADRQWAEWLYWATKLLNLLGHYSTRFVKLTQRQFAEATHPAAEQHEPLWLRFPHRYSTFGDWARGRYPHWFTYHRARITDA